MQDFVTEKNPFHLKHSLKSEMLIWFKKKHSGWVVVPSIESILLFKPKSSSKHATCLSQSKRLFSIKAWQNVTVNPSVFSAFYRSLYFIKKDSSSQAMISAALCCLSVA